jgi:hypothetical protein
MLVGWVIPSAKPKCPGFIGSAIVTRVDPKNRLPRERFLAMTGQTR